MVERKGATTTITKTVPRQRSGSGNSIEMRVEKNKCAEHARVTRSDPGYRVPTRRWHGNGEHARNTSGMVQTRAFHTSHAFIHGRHSSGYTFQGCILGAVRVRRGNSRSRDSSRSSGRRSFSERYLTNPRFPGATVVQLGESEFFRGRHRTWLNTRCGCSLDGLRQR